LIGQATCSGGAFGLAFEGALLFLFASASGGGMVV